MSYATPADMLSRFGERELVALTDRENVGVTDDDLLLEAITSAEGEVDAYLQTKYALPLTPVPVIVRDFVCDIARYRLCGNEATETDAIRTRYQDAIEFFKRVSKGDVQLGVDVNDATATVNGSVKKSTGDSVFNDQTMAGY